jgi:hypothetical protein
VRTCRARAEDICFCAGIDYWGKALSEIITFILLFLVFLAGGYGLGFTTLNSPRITDQIEVSQNLTLRAIWVLENIYLYLYGAAGIEMTFMVFESFGLVSSWSKIIDTRWKIMMIYGLLFLVCSAFGILTTTRAHRAAASSLLGYDPSVVRLRNIIDKLFTVTQAGLGLWVFTAALFILLPPIRRTLR